MRRAGWWALFGLLVIIVAFDVLVLIGVIVQAARGEEQGGLGAAIAAIVVVLAVGVGLALGARAVEHHVRLNHHPVGGRWGVPAGTGWHPSPPTRGFAASTSPASSTATTASDIGGAVVPEWTPSSPSRIGRVPRTRRRRHSPLAAGFGYFVLVAAAIGFLVATIISFSNWRTSVYIQDHGTPSTLTVTEVIQVQHDTRSGNYTTINLKGTLSPPVKSRSQTTVYTPHDNFFLEGQTVAVLVDPHDPSRSEIPGQADHSVGPFIVLLIFTIVIYGFTAFGALATLRMRRRRAARMV